MTTLHVGNFLSQTLKTYSSSEALTLRLVQRGHSVITTSSHQNRALRFLDMMLTTWNRRHDYEIAQIAVFSGPSFLWVEAVCALLRRLGKPYILTLHGGNLANFAKQHPKRVEALFKTAAAITTPSHMLQQAFLSIRPDLLLLPNGIELGNFTYRPRNSAEPRIGWLRAIHRIYSPQIAVEAAARLTNEFPQIELVMIGPNKDDQAYKLVEDTAERLNFKNRLKIVGAVPNHEVEKVLAPCDIFLNTTTIESFGKSVFEAAALGMCIVTTNAGELPHIWQHEHDALLIPPDDAEATAAAIRRLLKEPELAAKLSRNARQKAENHDWEAVIPRWESLFQQIKQKHL